MGDAWATCEKRPLGKTATGDPGRFTKLGMHMENSAEDANMEMGQSRRAGRCPCPLALNRPFISIRPTSRHGNMTPKSRAQGPGRDTNQVPLGKLKGWKARPARLPSEGPFKNCFEPKSHVRRRHTQPAATHASAELSCYCELASPNQSIDPLPLDMNPRSTVANVQLPGLRESRPACHRLWVAEAFEAGK